MTDTSTTRKPHGLAVLAAPLVAALLAAGCGTDSPPRAKPASVPSSTASALPTKAYTVQELGAALGCTPELVGTTSDFRQANCATPDSWYVLLDFDTAAGQRAWLDTALMYGGTYLVGDRWVLATDTNERLEQLRTTFGGAIERH